MFASASSGVEKSGVISISGAVELSLASRLCMGDGGASGGEGIGCFWMILGGLPGLRAVGTAMCLSMVAKGEWEKSQERLFLCVNYPLLRPVQNKVEKVRDSKVVVGFK